MFKNIFICFLIIATRIESQRPRKEHPLTVWTPYEKDYGGGYSYETIYRVMSTLRILIMTLFFEASITNRKSKYIRAWAFRDNISYAAELIFDIQMEYNNMVAELLKRYRENLQTWHDDYEQYVKSMVIMQRDCWDLENKIQLVIEIGKADMGGYIYNLRRSGKDLKDDKMPWKNQDVPIVNYSDLTPFPDVAKIKF